MAERVTTPEELRRSTLQFPFDRNHFGDTGEIAYEWEEFTRDMQTGETYKKRLEEFKEYYYSHNDQFGGCINKNLVGYFRHMHSQLKEDGKTLKHNPQSIRGWY